MWDAMTLAVDAVRLRAMSTTLARPASASGRWLAPALLSVGVAVGALGVWFFWHSRPTPGAYYEVFALDANTAVALRHEDGSERSFLELVELGHGVLWQALIPPYAGTSDAPAIAASSTAITVRVRRGGKDELWAMSTSDAEKLGQVELRPGEPRAGAMAPRIVTVADRAESFELVGDATRSTAVTAIELAEGAAKWRVDLGADDVAGAWLDARTLWIRTHTGVVFGLSRSDGSRVTGGVPSAEPVRRWHVADGAAWTIFPDHLEVHDAASGALRGTIGEKH